MAARAATDQAKTNDHHGPSRWFWDGGGLQKVDTKA
jgi:hypothetical protein